MPTGRQCPAPRPAAAYRVQLVFCRSSWSVGAGHHGVGDGLLKQVVERLTLAVIERAEDLVFDCGQRALGLCELLGAGVGELDQVPPPVLGRAPPALQRVPSASCPTAAISALGLDEACVRTFGGTSGP